MSLTILSISLDTGTQDGSMVVARILDVMDGMAACDAWAAISVLPCVSRFIGSNLFFIL